MVQRRHGNCFTALGLSPADVPTFQSFGALCSAAVGGGGGQCPTTTCGNGRTVEDRFVLVDQHMTFTQAQQYAYAAEGNGIYGLLQSVF